MTKRIPISEATPQQLRSFAETVLGLETSRTMNGPTLIGKIRAVGYNLDDIPAEMPGDGARKVSQVGLSGSWQTFYVEDPKRPGRPKMETDVPAGKKPVPQPHVKIRIPVSAKPGGDEPVPVSVNGRAIYIPRNTDCAVPLKYVEVLMQAEEFHYPEYDQSADLMGGLKEPTMVKSYDLSVLVPTGGDVFEDEAA